MNPFFEQPDAWHGFHKRFITYCADTLIERLRPNYLVKHDEHVYRDLTRGGPLRDGPAVERNSFIEIRDRVSREVVTVVELLSPANKRSGADREQYLAKRRQILQSPTHLVEIDLLRGWPRMPLDALPQCDYCVAVSRAEERPRVGIWPVRLRDPLPTIPIPLRGPDPDVQFDLARLIHRIHDAGGFADYMYDSPPEPPLHPDDAVWAGALARSANAGDRSTPRRPAG